MVVVTLCFKVVVVVVLVLVVVVVVVVVVSSVFVLWRVQAWGT